jgi:hypothetical protein
MSRLLNTLTKLGLGVALVGGAANSMLYNGNARYSLRNSHGIAN